MSNIAIGTYTLGHFLSALGESQEVWRTQKNYLLKYWLDNEYDFEIFTVDSNTYIHLKAAIVNYITMPNPLVANYNATTTSTWILGTCHKELSDTQKTDWTNIQTNQGLTEDIILHSFYNNNDKVVNVKYRDAKEEFFVKYGEYPVYAEKLVYTEKAPSA